jgi:hypothetical protein
MVTLAIIRMSERMCGSSNGQMVGAVYYAYIPEKKILLLLGGNKNGQDKDIRQAKKILRANIQKVE